MLHLNCCSVCFNVHMGLKAPMLSYMLRMKLLEILFVSKFQC